MRRISFPLLLLILLLSTAACQGQGDEAAATAEQIALGAEVYAQQCAECHGAALEGEPNWRSPNEDGTFRAPPHDETGHTWHHGDRQLLEAIRLGGERLPAGIGGGSNMPAFENVLTAAEMEAVLAFIKSSWPPDIQAAQATRTAAEESQP